MLVSHFHILELGRNIVHMLPKIVPDRLVLEEVSFQNVTDGVYKKLVSPKRKG